MATHTDDAARAARDELTRDAMAANRLLKSRIDGTIPVATSVTSPANGIQVAQASLSPPEPAPARRLTEDENNALDGFYELRDDETLKKLIQEVTVSHHPDASLSEEQMDALTASYRATLNIVSNKIRTEYEQWQLRETDTPSLIKSLTELNNSSDGLTPLKLNSFIATHAPTHHSAFMTALGQAAEGKSIDRAAPPIERTPEHTNASQAYYDRIVSDLQDSDKIISLDKASFDQIADANTKQGLVNQYVEAYNTAYSTAQANLEKGDSTLMDSLVAGLQSDNQVSATEVDRFIQAGAPGAHAAYLIGLKAAVEAAEAGAEATPPEEKAAVTDGFNAEAMSDLQTLIKGVRYWHDGTGTGNVKLPDSSTKESDRYGGELVSEVLKKYGQTGIAVKANELVLSGKSYEIGGALVAAIGERSKDGFTQEEMQEIVQIVQNKAKDAVVEDVKDQKDDKGFNDKTRLATIAKLDEVSDTLKAAGATEVSAAEEPENQTVNDARDPGKTATQRS